MDHEIRVFRKRALIDVREVSSLERSQIVSISSAQAIRLNYNKTKFIIYDPRIAASIARGNRRTDEGS
jgi:hypothetical protein